MLENVLKLIQSPVADAIKKSNEIPAEKQELAIHSTTNAIAETLQKNITPDNITQLTDLFSGGSSALSKSNFLVDAIKSTVVNVLSSKIGISKTTANSIASVIIPTLMNTLSSKISGGKGDGIDLGSLIGMFSGDNHGKSEKGSIAGGLLGSLGKLFK